MGSLTGRVRRQSAHRRYAVHDPADVGALRRAVAGHLGHLGHAGSDSSLLARAELAATELGTSLLRHPRPPGGWVLLRSLHPNGLELIAVDRGRSDHGAGGHHAADPGADHRAAGLPVGAEPPPDQGHGLALGLAAVRRAASRFDIHTRRGRGTSVLAVIEETANAEPGPVPADPVRRWAGVSVGITGAECGDGWAVADLGDGATAVAVVDGLGHGPNASVAADAALNAFAAAPGDIDGYLARANDAMWGTRGGAVLVCRMEPARGLVHYLSVGNVEGCVVPAAGAPRYTLTGDYGTLGAHLQPPRARVKHASWPAGATLVVWTDGLSSRLSSSADAELLSHDPALAAAALHRDHTRDRDDATVVVVHDPVAARGPVVGQPVVTRDPTPP